MRLLLSLAMLFAVVAITPALALDPDRSLDQFGHTALTVKEGAPGSVYALAQTRNGFLWIGTAKGLYRYDGIHFVEIPSFQEQPARSDGVTALLATRTGELWVGHYWGGVSVLRNGRLRNMNSAPVDGTICGMAQTKDGAIWVASDGRSQTQLRRYFRGRWDIINAGERGLPAANLTGVLAAHDGSLWAVMLNSVVRLAPGASTFQLIGDKVDQASALTEDADGRIWVLDASGVRPLIGRAEPHKLGPSEDTRLSDIASFITDRQGELWEASALGLVRVRHPSAYRPGIPADVPDRVKPNAGILSSFPNALLEDHEGDIWIGSDQGLDRLRTVSVANDNRAPSQPGIADEHALMLPAAGGDFYTLTSSEYGKLDPGKPQHVQFNRKGAWTDLTGIAGHPSAACVGGDGSLWLADRVGLHNIKDARIARVVAWPAAVIGTHVTGCQQSEAGPIWIASENAGMFRFDGKSWSHFANPPQYNRSLPYSWTVDGQGRLLASFGTKDFVRSDSAHIETLIPESRLDIRLVETIYCLGNRIIAGGEKGLMVGDGNRFVTLSSARFPYLAHVNGLSRTASGDLWIGSAAGLVRVAEKNLDRALHDPNADLDPRIFGYHDGLGSEEADQTKVIESRDGRLWITIQDGMVLGWIDPRHLRHNDVPPPVLLQSLSVNGRPHAMGESIILPAGVKRLQIGYTATSLAAPERVTFRYRLDGVDKDWIEAGTERQAVYTNLSPGDYNFRVIAANEDGVWNTAGAGMGLQIPPTFLQSRIFLALCIAAAAAIVWLFYRVRIKLVSDRLRLRLEERIAERERIARDLHDTLLQGVQALIFRFHAVAARIDDRQKAHALMEQALNQADQVVAEARDRVVQLRQLKAEGSLPQKLETSAARILADSNIAVKLTVEGTPRPLAALAEEELVSIADEFMVNTMEHSGARHLEIAVNYGRRALLLQLRDDGRGIGPDIIRNGGREGHFGLRGMRERGQKLSADFALSSQPDAGVVLSLKVPAAIAYIRRQREVFGWARETSRVAGS